MTTALASTLPAIAGGEPAKRSAFGREDRLHLGEGVIDVGIDHDVIVLGPVAHLVGGLGHAGVDYLVGILGTCVQPLLESLDRRRQDEHAHHVFRRAAA